MTTNQENKQLAYRALKGVCETNKSVWIKMKAFADGFAEFTDMVEGIEELATAQASPTTGITQDKRNLRRTMAKAALTIAGPVGAFAAKTNNRELLAKVDFRLSALLSGRDKTSLDRCQGIQAATATVVKQLADYNITAADLKDLQDKIDAYDAILTKPREVRASVKTITLQLGDAFDEVDQILDERLDKLVERFRVENSGFVSDYENARRIVGVSASRATKQSPPVAPALVGAQA